MPSRQRQFSDIRSQTGSRCVSQISDSISIVDRLSFQSSTHQNQDCIGCFNKNMANSRKEEQKRKRQQQNKQHLQTIKKINSKRDFQKEHRQRMLKQASEYNKSLAVSQRESIKNLKKIQDSQTIEQIKKKQQQLDQAHQDFKKSRIQLKQKYHQQLKSQLHSQRSEKQLKLSQSRVSDISATTTNLKLIQESQRYFNKMKEQTKKCQQLNKSLMLQKSYRKVEQRQEKVQKEKEHIERVEKQFTKFTEFQAKQQNSNKQSRSILSSSSITQNPQDVFTQLKRIQTEKKKAMLAQRRQKHTQRMMELKRIQQQNRAKIHNKIKNMKTYVQQLTHQVREKKQRKAKQLHYQKHYQPKKSKVDYFTEQIGKKLSACGSCDRVVDKKLISHK